MYQPTDSERETADPNRRPSSRAIAAVPPTSVPSRTPKRRAAAAIYALSAEDVVAVATPGRLISSSVIGQRSSG